MSAMGCARDSTRRNDRLASIVTRGAVATLVLTSVHHVYGAFAYATPWRLHVLGLTVPAMLVIALSKQRVVRPPTNAVARWAFILTTLAVPILGIGLFEGFYNHLVKDALFFCGAPRALMTRFFPPPTYEMPNDAFFEVTGVAQVVAGALTAWHLYRFADSRAQLRDRSRFAANVVTSRPLTTIRNEAVSIPDATHLVHLQFRRFAGCPVCNLHLHSFVRRHDEVQAANVREVVVFHSSVSELRAYAADLPFAVIADPTKALYAEFGVGESPRAVLDPRAWGAIVRGVFRSLVEVLYRRAPLPSILPQGGGLGLPADFLIARDGRIVASKYGQHADDQWSVDELLAHARTAE
jgi:peroxiredoxin